MAVVSSVLDALSSVLIAASLGRALAAADGLRLFVSVPDEAVGAGGEAAMHRGRVVAIRKLPRDGGRFAANGQRFGGV
jgi:hypothetical protein